MITPSHAGERMTQVVNDTISFFGRGLFQTDLGLKLTDGSDPWTTLSDGI